MRLKKLTWLAGLVTCSLSATDKPNIIYILADDMGYGDVQSYNPESKIATPHLNKLSEQGMNFTDAHTNSSVCTPTRYGILTGRYCWRTEKKSGVTQGLSPHLIKTDRMTVASYLKSKDYNTACIGKWHLGMDFASKDDKDVNKDGMNVDFSQAIKNGPNALGFDEYFGIAASLNHSPHAFIHNDKILGPFTYIDDKKALKARRIQGKLGWVSDSYEQDQVLKTLTQKTSEWIHQQKKDKPFFIYMPLPSPHAPLVPSKDFLDKSGINLYADFTMETDWVVGQVMKALDESGHADNTLVIFTADNGCSPQAGLDVLQGKEHFPGAHFRGLKGSLWEAGHRVPFIVRWPGQVKPASQQDQLICTTDLLATVAAIHGDTLPANAGEDSKSFSHYMKGAQSNDEARGPVVHHSDAGIFSIRSGKWKVVFDEKGGTRRVNPKDKPLINPAKIQLFNLEADPSETTNLQVQHPEVVKKMHSDLLALIEAGRSNAGSPQTNEMGKGGWRQLEDLKRF
jgi:arylsulfatase A